ncbi:MAG: tRNA guanosine(34) transglycosylase Tgt [Candidatus Sungbacteria bacterium]|nr:tRNA guanosine(34) transglycosylase Tgt [Candidatus Sungbacteria bacterium]
MIEFKILKQSKKSRARVGVIKTPHGEVETPAYVGVATLGAVKTLTAEQAEQTGTQLLIANTFHLHEKPGEKIVKAAGGLHEFMQWHRPLMTDSGGFQVFSLGFGKDFGMGKVLKNNERAGAEIKSGQQPKLLRITDDGVHFRSLKDGRKLFLGPKESIRIQQQLGADIMLAFDECPSPIADYAYTKESLVRTHRWAKDCLKAHTSKQSLFGIVQGGRFRDLREESASFIGSLPFGGFAIGGEFGDSKKGMAEMLRWVMKKLPDEKPRHLLGIGYLEDIPRIVREGVDTFDCIVPTHYARHGVAFTSEGKLHIGQARFAADQKPLDKKCACSTCALYSRSYLAHLFRAKEINALQLLTFHNLFFFQAYVKKIREDIKKGKL